MSRLDKGVRAPLFGAALVVATVLAGCRDAPAPRRDAAVATPVDPTTAGTIHVDVAFSGTPPPGKVLDMRSAAQCAAAHPEPVRDPSWVVQSGKLANAVVWIKSGLEKWTFAVPAEPVVVDQKDCLYVPHVAAAVVGQTVRFQNSDSDPHNVRGRPQVVGSWNFIISRQGSSRDVVFDKPEIGIPVGCDIHPWMSGYLAVVPHPYVGVTSADGTVWLTNVPPGEYVVGVWHEKGGTREQRVTLQPKGSANVRVEYGAPE